VVWGGGGEGGAGGGGGGGGWNPLEVSSMGRLAVLHVYCTKACIHTHLEYIPSNEVYVDRYGVATISSLLKITCLF